MNVLFLMAFAFVVGVIVGNKYMPTDFVNQIWLWLVAAFAAVSAYVENIWEGFGG